jgi:hypothetical protein
MPGLGLFNQLVARSRAIIVHARAAELAVRAVREAAPVIVVPHPVNENSGTNQSLLACLAGYDRAIEIARTQPERDWAIEGDWEFSPPRPTPLLAPQGDAGELWWASAMVPVGGMIPRTLGLPIPSVALHERLSRDHGYSDIRTIDLRSPAGGGIERRFDLIVLRASDRELAGSLGASLRAANRCLKAGGLLISDLWQADSEDDRSRTIPAGCTAMSDMLLQCGFALDAYAETTLDSGLLECCARGIKVSEYLADPVSLVRHAGQTHTARLPA